MDDETLKLMIAELDDIYAEIQVLLANSDCFNTYDSKYKCLVEKADRQINEIFRYKNALAIVNSARSKLVK